ncbi:MAG: hypothetical protein NC222_06965 [Staphylococcus sp.]|nr:hypothetical protein [Staphylococcus sp.]
MPKIKIDLELNNLEMPENCYNCRFWTYEVGIYEGYCILTLEFNKDRKTKRCKNCPLKEVKPKWKLF